LRREWSLTVIIVVATAHVDQAPHGCRS
jgi:hypothetical protein